MAKLWDLRSGTDRAPNRTPGTPLQVFLSAAQFAPSMLLSALAGPFGAIPAWHGITEIPWEGEGKKVRRSMLAAWLAGYSNVQRWIDAGRPGPARAPRSVGESDAANTNNVNPSQVVPQALGGGAGPMAPTGGYVPGYQSQGGPGELVDVGFYSPGSMGSQGYYGLRTNMEQRYGDSAVRELSAWMLRQFGQSALTDLDTSLTQFGKIHDLGTFTAGKMNSVKRLQLATGVNVPKGEFVAGVLVTGTTGATIEVFANPKVGGNNNWDQDDAVNPLGALTYDDVCVVPVDSEGIAHFSVWERFSEDVYLGIRPEAGSVVKLDLYPVDPGTGSDRFMRPRGRLTFAGMNRR